MTPTEFVLWMNGAAGLLEGDEPPTKEQWAKIKAKLAEPVGAIAANKLLEEADNVLKKRREMEDQYAQATNRAKLYGQGIAQAQTYADVVKQYAGMIPYPRGRAEPCAGSTVDKVYEGVTLPPGAVLVSK